MNEIRLHPLDALTDAVAIRAGLLDPASVRANPRAVELVEDEVPVLRSWVTHFGLNQRGYVSGMSDMAVFALGLTSGGFSQAFSITARDVIYQGMQPHTEYRSLCGLGELPDFRPADFPLLDTTPDFPVIAPGAEAPHLSVVEVTGLQAGLATYGRNIAIHRNLLINDDVEFVAQVFRSIGASAARAEAEKLYALLESNPNLKDGQPMFSADAGNLELNALDESSLSSAIARLRNASTSKGALGNFEATALVVAPDIELTASKLLFSCNLTKVRLIVAAWLAAGRWYLSADPVIAPCVALRHLKGANGAPQVGRAKKAVEMAATDAAVFGVRHDFAVVPVGRAGIVRGGV